MERRSASSRMENSVWGLFLPRLSSNIDAFSPHHTVLNKTIMSKNSILDEPNTAVFCVKIHNWTPKMFSNKTNFWTQKVILEQCVASPKPKVLFKKYVNDRGNRGKKSHMSYALKNVREKCIWSISQNTLRFIYMVIIASFLCGALPASQLMHHPTTYFFLLLLCWLSLLLCL